MARDESGMTLMELIIVIAILGMILTMVLPVGGALDNNVKRKKTINLLESIRFALVGAENAHDANGNRVIGGYVGDFGTLPDLIVHEWDSAAGAWNIPKETDGGPKTSDNSDFRDWVMPRALWEKTFTVGGGPYTIAGKDKWSGPYLAKPRDDYPSDDDLYSYTPGASPGTSAASTNRLFCLRQGTGRLTDGWGSSLLVYKDSNKTLHFVSVGRDRQVDFPDPTDQSKPHNKDNLVLSVPEEQWKLDGQKAAETRNRLRDVKAAILGRTTSYVPGQWQPSGYAVDMGSLETLMGSYVTHGGTTYHCIRRHTANSAPSGSSPYWEEADGTYPHAPAWKSGTVYHGQQMQLLTMNADYVKYDSDGNGTFTFYRCIKDTTQSPSNAPDSWVKDDSYAHCEWVQKYKSGLGESYRRAILPAWQFYPGLAFGAGWRGPYTTNPAPLTDAWGNGISVSLRPSAADPTKTDDDGSIIFTSKAANTADTKDDLHATIVRTDYMVPVTVTVRAAKDDAYTAVNCKASDYVSAYCPSNGHVGHFAAASPAITPTAITDSAGTILNDGKFFFNNDKGGSFDSYTPSTLPPEITESKEKPAGAVKGPWLPVGPAMIVYRNDKYTDKAGNTYASPNPTVTGPGATGLKGPPGYQKAVIIEPRTSHNAWSLGE